MALAIIGVNGSVAINAALKEALGISGQQQTLNPSQHLPLTFSNGTGADQCNKFVSFSGSVTSGAAVSHDLTGGSTLIDMTTGAAVAFSRVVGILVINYSTTTYLTIGGGSNALAAYTNSMPVGPSTTQNPGVHLNIRADATGMAVTAGTGDIFKVDCGAGSADYKIIMWGS
jgi:hypothetical protein